jgi:hypothetical protein
MQRCLGVGADEAGVDVCLGIDKCGNGGGAAREMAGPVGKPVQKSARLALVAQACGGQAGVVGEEPAQRVEVSAATASG